MAYAKINKSGCVERHGNVQVRVDFYLEPTDPRYIDTLVDVPVLDDKGEPTGKAFQQLNPFHSHFMYFSPDVTEAEILKEAEYHLPNFYTAFQNQWDKYKGGMRHGWATEKRIRPDRKDKTLKDYEAVRQSCEAKITKLTEASTSVNDLEGREYPATEIDIGSPAIDRGEFFNLGGNTSLLFENPANDTGVIDTVEIWANTALSDTVVGTLYLDSGTTYIGRDYESIGTVPSGSKQTFSGLDIDVETGDYIGIYVTSGRYERDSSGYAGIRRNPSGNVWSGGSTSFSYLVVKNTISLYGTGETVTPVTVTPTTASLELTTYAPTVIVSDHKEVVPEIAELELTPYPPEALTPQTITPEIAELVLEAFAPGIELTILATPGVAALALTSFAPSIQKTNDWLITPGVAELEFTLYAPSLTPGEVIRPGAASLVLTTYAPGIVTPVSVAISVAELELTRYAPGVTATDHQSVTPGIAELVLETFAPTIYQHIIKRGWVKVKLKLFKRSVKVKLPKRYIKLKIRRK